MKTSHLTVAELLASVQEDRRRFREFVLGEYQTLMAGKGEPEWSAQRLAA